LGGLRATPFTVSIRMELPRERLMSGIGGSQLAGGRCFSDRLPGRLLPERISREIELVILDQSAAIADEGSAKQRVVPARCIDARVRLVREMHKSSRTVGKTKPDAMNVQCLTRRRFF